MPETATAARGALKTKLISHGMIGRGDFAELRDIHEIESEFDARVGSLAAARAA